MLIRSLHKAALPKILCDNYKNIHKNKYAALSFRNAFTNSITMKQILCFILLCRVLIAPDILYSMNNCKGSGNLRTEFRKTTPFSRIESRINANIHIIKSNSINVQITAHGKLLPLIRLSERNGLLIISAIDHSVFPDSSVSINIYLPGLDEIILSGTGEIHSECPVQRIVLKGSGSITVEGKTKYTSILLSGTGNINLYSMKVNSADVVLSGKGSITLYAKDKLGVFISGDGKLIYRGNPVIHKEISERGSLVCKN